MGKPKSLKKMCMSNINKKCNFKDLKQLPLPKVLLQNLEKRWFFDQLYTNAIPIYKFPVERIYFITLKKRDFPTFLDNYILNLKKVQLQIKWNINYQPVFSQKGNCFKMKYKFCRLHEYQFVYGQVNMVGNICRIQLTPDNQKKLNVEDYKRKKGIFKNGQFSVNDLRQLILNKLPWYPYISISLDNFETEFLIKTNNFCEYGTDYVGFLMQKNVSGQNFKNMTTNITAFLSEEKK